MTELRCEPGSFRDRHGRVFYCDGEVFRALSQKSLADFKHLAATRFYQDLVREGALIASELVKDLHPSELNGDWAGVLRHERIPVVSYPYEWSFSMLQDAALLQLRLARAALAEEMIPKDATSYNIQWVGKRPVFIDTASLERLQPGCPWAGYRQFCQLFLYPLLLQAYKNVHFQPWLRGNIEGIEASQLGALMSARDLLRRGVFTHVYLQSKLQKRYADNNDDVRGQIKQAGFNKELILANLAGLTRLVERLSWSETGSTWSGYAETHSYSERDHQAKVRFVRKTLGRRPRRLVWDLGCNIGVFSRIASESAQHVLALDADHLTVDRLYTRLRGSGPKNILPLVANLADPAPNLGWRGQERQTLLDRGRPDFLLVLALIHHLVIGANIPVRELVEWLASLGAELVIEFVSKQDPMVERLLSNKDDQYDDYDQSYLEGCLSQHFEIVARQNLLSETRTLYHLQPWSRG